MSLAPLIPDPALAEDEWLKRAREQMDRANAAMPGIVEQMNAEYRKSRIGKGRRPRREIDPSVNYIPGFEEDWTVG
jgi:hypothetical protein